LHVRDKRGVAPAELAILGRPRISLGPAAVTVNRCCGWIWWIQVFVVVVVVVIVVVLHMALRGIRNDAYCQTEW
jgi:hypothetical protein